MRLLILLNPGDIRSTLSCAVTLLPRGKMAEGVNRILNFVCVKISIPLSTSGKASHRSLVGVAPFPKSLLVYLQYDLSPLKAVLQKR